MSRVPHRSARAFSICCRGALAGAHETQILHLAIVLGRENVGAPLALLLRSDISDHVINAHRISALIEPPNSDAFFASAHG